ncbi:1-phosphofructokinase family hexose kinase [Bradyrhizobium sp. WD16]|uniref:1-phosphofructokinase family hexose kinase n=1 Tax=Bradyrhizobium sp. WD16 TaxID=1521768 RepID=UPI0020A49720|nr:1-phosphofructokinase family hexose kinase [Bradyrhizobium sp. WD16]
MADAALAPIATLTINPAVDVSTTVKKIVPFTKMRCSPEHRDPGGGGINVARVLKRLGIDAATIYPAGGGTGQLLSSLIEREGLRSVVIPTTHETRQDITVFDEMSRQQYRFVFPGEPLAEMEWQTCLKLIGALSPPPRFVVASGSLPPGVPEDFFGRVVLAAKEMGSRAIIDTAGPLLKPALEHGAYLIKPNLGEYQTLAGTASADEAALIGAGRHLIERYHIEIIALSMGPAGALLITRDIALRAKGLPIEPKSVSGAGDSFLAAMIWSLMTDDSLSRALRYGVAGGSAALLNPGTELCRAEDVHRLASEVVIVPAGNHRHD